MPALLSVEVVVEKLDHRITRSAHVACPDDDVLVLSLGCSKLREHVVLALSKLVETVAGEGTSRSRRER